MDFKIKKASDFLLSRDGPSIIGVRELDFRVRNGNGYYLSTMATSIYYNVKNEVRKFCFYQKHAGRII